MRTIQEYLKECDREKIINSYIYHHLFHHDLLDERYEDVTIGELKERMTKRLNDFIDRLVALEPADSGDDPGILMVRHSSGFGTLNDDIDINLVYKSEVMEEYIHLHAYAYSLEKHEKMLSYYVADTYLTQYYIEELIKDFLHEALIMGLEQERRESFLEDINNAKEACKEGNEKCFYSLEEMKDELEKECGFEWEKKDERQEEAENNLLKAKLDYDYLCKKIEVEKLKRLIENESL